SHLQANGAARGDGGDEVEADAELLELNGDGTGSTCRGPLNDGEGILAAGEEAGLLAVLSDEVRLGEHLDNAFLFERLEGGAEVEVRPEDGEVEGVGNS